MKIAKLPTLVGGLVLAVVAFTQVTASAIGTLPPAGQSTPAISFSGTLNVAVPTYTSAKQIWVGFWNDPTSPATYVDPRSTAGLQWGGNDSCSAGTCDDQIIIDINGESYHRAYSVDKFASGYMIRLDYTDVNAPGPQLGDVVTVKMAAGAFNMPADTTGFKPYIRIDRISTNSQNGALQGNVEATIASPLPDSPDVPQAPTATAGEEQATVTITPNSGGEAVTTYRITSSPDGQTCDITPPETSCDVTGLQGGTSYTFTAVALNAGFPSSASSASNSVTPTAAPAGSSSSDGTSRSGSSSTSHSGIFLTVHGESGSTLARTDVRYGSYAIQSNSPYLLSLREGTTMTNQRVLASGRANSGGHLDRTSTLPALPAGTHTVVLSAYDKAGNPLILGNTLTVSASGKITSVTPESRQPSIR